MSKKPRKKQRVVGRIPQSKRTQIEPAETNQQKDHHDHWHLYKNGEPVRALEQEEYEVAIPQSCKECGVMLAPIIVYLHPEYKEMLDKVVAEQEVSPSGVIETAIEEYTNDYEQQWSLETYVRMHDKLVEVLRETEKEVLAEGTIGTLKLSDPEATKPLVFNYVVARACHKLTGETTFSESVISRLMQIVSMDNAYLPFGWNFIEKEMAWREDELKLKLEGS